MMVRLTMEKILRSVPGWKKNQNELPQKFLRKLTHLHLEEKDLTEVDGRLLKSCTNLVVLYLFDNSLTQIPTLCSCCSTDSASTDSSYKSLTGSTSELDSTVTNASHSDLSHRVDNKDSSSSVTSHALSDLSLCGVGRGGCFTPHLSMLYLQNNSIISIEHLHSLTSLIKLYLGGNSISMLEGLEDLHQLQELHIENQRLELGERLYIDHRSIQAVANTLVVLNVSGNNLTSLSDFRPLTRLTDLSAASNCVSNLDLLTEDLEVMKCVTRLDVTDNPVCSMAKYRDRVILATQRIEHLDGKPVTDMSRKFLQNWHASRVATANGRARGRSQEFVSANGGHAMNGHPMGESDLIRPSANHRQVAAVASGDSAHYLAGARPPQLKHHPPPHFIH